MRCGAKARSPEYRIVNVPAWTRSRNNRRKAPDLTLTRVRTGRLPGAVYVAVTEPVAAAASRPLTTNVSRLMRRAVSRRREGAGIVCGGRGATSTGAGTGAKPTET